MVTRRQTRLALALAISLGAITTASAQPGTRTGTAEGHPSAGLICAQDGFGLTVECDSHLLPWAYPQSPTTEPEGWRGGPQLRSPSDTTRGSLLAPTRHDVRSVSLSREADALGDAGPWFPASLVASGKADLPPPLHWF